MIALLLDTLRSRRVSTLVLLGGLITISVGYLALFPQLETQLQSFAGDLPEFYGAIVGDADFSTPDGYVRTQVYALLAPLITAGVAMGAAAGLARAERDATLGATYLAPVSRDALALSYLGVAWSIALVGGVAVLVGVALGAPLAGAEVSMGGIVAATLPLVGVAAAASATTWAVGAATGAPGAASGAGWTFVGLSFLTNSVGEVVAGASWLTSVSPWGWYGAGKAIDEGFDPASLLLFAWAAGAAALGVWAFRRRDLQL